MATPPLLSSSLAGGGEGPLHLMESTEVGVVIWKVKHRDNERRSCHGERHGHNLVF